MVSQVGGRTFRVKILKCFFLVSLAPLGLERSGKTDFTAPEPQEAEKMLHQLGPYVDRSQSLFYFVPHRQAGSSNMT